MIGSSGTEVVPDASGTVIVVAAPLQLKQQQTLRHRVPRSKFELCYLLRQYLPQDPLLELPQCSLQTTILNVSGNDEKESIRHIYILLPS